MLTLRFCVRRQSVASLKTNTGTRPSVGATAHRGPLTNPITCERTDAACHFAPTSITLDTRIAHLQKEVDIDSRGKQVLLVAVEGHRRQRLVPWLLGVEQAQLIQNAPHVFPGMRNECVGVALPV